MGEHTVNSSKPGVVRGADASGDRRSRRYHVWVMGTALLAIAGVVGSVFAAGALARNVEAKSRQAFKSSSVEVASTLQLAIQHEEDLNVSAGGFLAGNANATQTQFSQWVNSVQALERYPEIVDIGAVASVPAAELAAFAARAAADPAGPLAADGTLQVTPPGDRPFYCLVLANVSRNPQERPSAGIDYCAGLPQIVNVRDSAQSFYLPFAVKSVNLLAVETPVYRGGVVPATVEARREAFLGVVGLTLAPDAVLTRALKSHPNVGVIFRFHDAQTTAVFRSGKAPTGASAVMADLHNGWTVETFGAVASAGVFENGNAVMLLIAGALSSLLVAGFVFVLGTGRARALRLVGERTGELRHQALHDPLTDLPNRALIADRIEQLLARNRRHGTSGAALYIDLDDFKNVNDTLGHEAGDQLLIAVATRLESALRDADTIARMGGDEFVVLIDGASLEVAPELVAERLLDVMRQPFELSGASKPLAVNTSIGIAMGDRATGSELLRDADVALYQAKAGGKNRYEIFHPEMQTEISNRIELEFDLRSALEDGQFRLAYQPIYNLDDLTLVGVEALIRWEHPTRGIVLPDEFIPTLEQTGQIREVGRWVLMQACGQMAEWHARGDTLDVSVNVSGRQLDSDAIVDHVREALQVSGLDATSLIIEVTETALMRNAKSTALRLQAIKDFGVRIAVDDFGTGYSSLAYLQQFPVDCLKIDRTFTNAITTSPESRALIRTLVQLGKDLGLKTLAEGVETTGEMDELRSEHVNEAQGFLMSRPLDPETLETQLLVPARPATPTATRP